MRRKKHTAEGTVARSREVDVLVSQRRKAAEAIRSIEMTEVIHYHRRSEYGGLKGDQVKRSKSLETENLRRRGHRFVESKPVKNKGSERRPI